MMMTWIFDDEFDQKLFQVRFDVSEEKSCKEAEEYEEKYNQSESNLVNKERKKSRFCNASFLLIVFLLTSEKGCFISRLILY